MSTALDLQMMYAELPHLDCRGLCAESCGPIVMGPAERQRIVEKTGEDPSWDPTTLACTLLKDQSCTVYRLRPMICRLWGVVETMPCPYGCKPDRYLTNAEGHELLDRAMAVE